MAKKTATPEPVHNKEEIVEARRAVLAQMEVVQNAFAMRREVLAKLIDPQRNIDSECGYPIEVSKENYIDFYKRHGIANRVVNIYPEECWKKDPEVYDDEDEDTETEFEKEWDKLVKTHNVYHYLQRIDKLSGIGHYGILLIGTDDGGKLDTPVAGVEEALDAMVFNAEELPTSTRKKAKLLYLRCFDESLCAIDSYETDETKRRFGQPVMYSLQFVDPRQSVSGMNPTQQTTSKKVHWSRVIHIADGILTSEVIGTPRMEDVFNDLYDLKKTKSGGAEMLWRGGFPGYSFEVSPEYASQVEAMGDEFKKEIKEEMNKFANSLQRYMSLIGVSTKSLAPQVADPMPQFNMSIEAICIAKACPIRIFKGSERGELASSQDSIAWNDRLTQRNNCHVTPQIVRPFIERLVAMGVLPEPKNGPKEAIVEWPDLNAPSDDSIAGTALKTADALSKYMTGQVEQIIPPLEFLIHFLKMPKDTAEAIMKAAEENLDTIADRQDALMPPETREAGELERERFEEEKKQNKKPLPAPVVKGPGKPPVAR